MIAVSSGVTRRSYGGCIEQHRPDDSVSLAGILSPTISNNPTAMRIISSTSEVFPHADPF